MRVAIAASLLTSAFLSAAPSPETVQPQITPLAGPIVQNWAEMFVSGDFIYWQLKENGLAYALDGNTFGVTEAGGYKMLDFKYEPGFKAALGVDFRHDGWDLELEYTWLQQQSTSSKAVANPAKGHLVGLEAIGINQEIIGHFRSQFNALDWDLGRNFYVSPHLALHPYVGLKGAWIKQHFNNTLYTLLGGELLDYSLGQQLNMWGVGLRGGLGTQWHFTRNWSFYGNLALDELYECFDVSNVLKEVTTDTNLTNVRNVFHLINPVFEIALGLRYETFFSQDRYQMVIQAGWEQQIWLGTQQWINSFRYPQGTNLTLQGLDVKFGFCF